MAAIVIDPAFALKEVVYLLTDEEQKKRIITSIIICADGGILYELNCGTLQSRHYDCEISREVDYVAKTTN